MSEYEITTDKACGYTDVDKLQIKQGDTSWTNAGKRERRKNLPIF